MIKHVLLVISVAQLMTSCSSMIPNQQRTIAQLEGEKTVMVLDQLAGIHPCEADKNISDNLAATFVYYDDDSLLVITDDSISSSHAQNCSSSFVKINKLDQVLRMLTHADSGLWFHTLHGHVYRYDGNEIRKIAFDFPVSAFEFDGDKIKLYHSNKQGRYCDFDTLSLPLGQRPSTCQYIEAEFNWRDL